MKNLINIQEKIVPISVIKGNKRGFVYKDTETGKTVTGFIEVSSLNPDQTREISKYTQPGGSQGYKLDPGALKPTQSTTTPTQPPAPSRTTPTQPPAPSRTTPTQPTAPSRPAPAQSPAPSGTPPAQSPAPSQPAAGRPTTPPAQPHARPAPAQSKEVSDYMTAAAKARQSKDQSEMDKVRDTGLEIWRKKYADTLAKNVNPNGTQRGTGQSVMARQAQELRDLRPVTTTTQTSAPTTPLTSTDPEKAFFDRSRETARNLGLRGSLRNLAGPEAVKNLKNSYEYDAFNLVLEYLFSQGHVETLDEALYVMMEMDNKSINNIIQERAWWDPAGLFTKTQRERALEKPSRGYNRDYGITTRGDKNQVIIAPITSGGVTKWYTQQPSGDPPSGIYGRASANHPSWRDAIERYKAAYPEKWKVTQRTAEKQIKDINAADTAAMNRQIVATPSGKDPEFYRPPTSQPAATTLTRSTATSTRPTATSTRPTASPSSISSPPAPTKPIPTPEPKLTKSQQDILDLRQLRANSLNRQGDIKGSQALQTEIDIARASQKMPSASTQTQTPTKVDTSSQRIQAASQPAIQSLETQPGSKTDTSKIERSRGRGTVQLGGPVNASYQYDAFNLVLEYLFSQGHVETLDEALYVMMEMNAECIQSIVEGGPLLPGEQGKAPSSRYKEPTLPGEERLTPKLKELAPIKSTFKLPPA